MAGNTFRVKEGRGAGERGGIKYFSGVSQVILFLVFLALERNSKGHFFIPTTLCSFPFIDAIHFALSSHFGQFSLSFDIFTK